MTNATLLSHVDTDRITRGELQTLATPDATATFKPIPHFELVDMLDRVLNRFDIHIRSEQFAVRRDGSVLFGVFELAWRETQDGIAALGLRTANNKTMSLQICAGLSVFVCDNMVFRGDLIALKRRHTSGLNVREELAAAVERFQEHYTCLTREIEYLKTRELTDTNAKVFLHDVFTRGVMPVRLLPAASQAYFEPPVPDFEPRNAWSLHNALTHAAKEMPMTTRMPAIQRVGKLFGMSSEQPLLLPPASDTVAA